MELTMKNNWTFILALVFSYYHSQNIHTDQKLDTINIVTTTFWKA